jgi:hypothetical protein
VHNICYSRIEFWSFLKNSRCTIDAIALELGFEVFSIIQAAQILHLILGREVFPRIWGTQIYCTKNLGIKVLLEKLMKNSGWSVWYCEDVSCYNMQISCRLVVTNSRILIWEWRLGIKRRRWRGTRFLSFVIVVTSFLSFVNSWKVVKRMIKQYYHSCKEFRVEILSMLEFFLIL